MRWYDPLALDRFLAAIEYRPQGIVYVIRNRLDGREYVGATVRTLRNRWKDHNRDYEKAGSPLHKDMKLLSPGYFEVEQIASCLDLRELGLLEQEIIEQRKPFYNVKREITVWEIRGRRVFIHELPALVRT